MANTGVISFIQTHTIFISFTYYLHLVLHHRMIIIIITIALHIALTLTDKLYCLVLYAECWQTSGMGLRKCIKSLWHICGQTFIQSASWLQKTLFLSNINYLNIFLYNNLFPGIAWCSLYTYFLTQEWMHWEVIC